MNTLHFLDTKHFSLTGCTCISNTISKLKMRIIVMFKSTDFFLRVLTITSKSHSIHKIPKIN